uniref:Uncharacterized protein n=1 Tax=Octopus bimaculoides TaxID=37653 RepID=A0A0L8ICE4_OCTBM
MVIEVYRKSRQKMVRDGNGTRRRTVDCLHDIMGCHCHHFRSHLFLNRRTYSYPGRKHQNSIVTSSYHKSNVE